MKQSLTKQRITRVVITLLVMMLTNVGAWAASIVSKPLIDPVIRNGKYYTEGMYWVSLPYTSYYDNYVTTLSENDINKCNGKFKVYDSEKYQSNYRHDSHGSLVIKAPTGYIFQISGSISTHDENERRNEKFFKIYSRFAK